MKTPAIQNDFSYYRRTLTRASLARQENAEKDLVVGNELANRMSLFYAHATPMLRVLSHATITFLMDVSGIASLLCTLPLSFVVPRQLSIHPDADRSRSLRIPVESNRLRWCRRLSCLSSCPSPNSHSLIFICETVSFLIYSWKNFIFSFFDSFAKTGSGTCWNNILAYSFRLDLKFQFGPSSRHFDFFLL